MTPGTVNTGLELSELWKWNCLRSKSFCGKTDICLIGIFYWKILYPKAYFLSSQIKIM